MEYGIRSSSAVASWEVGKRDHGVCATCGLDTELLDRVLRRAAASLAGQTTEHWWRSVDRHRKYELRALVLGAIGFSEAIWKNGAHLWEADHVVPVEEGGGSCSLDNYQTLCRPCHFRKTRSQGIRRP